MAKPASVANTISHHSKLHHSARGTRNQEIANSNALNTVLKVIADQAHFDLKQASDLTKTALLQDPDLSAKFIKLARQKKVSADEVIRMIRIFECICSKPELLDHLLRLENLDHPRVRSKVVLTIGRLVQNTSWLREQLQDPNSRVRANAIEALWEVQVEGAEELLLRAAFDSNNRVIGNAAYGLYKLGNPKAVPILYSLLRHPDPLFRISGLWVVTQLGDPRFLEYVQMPPAHRVEGEKEASLRATAQQRLAARLWSARFAGKLTLALSSFKMAGMETRFARFSCLSSQPDICFGPPELSKLSFVIEEDGREIEEFECCWMDPVEKISSVIVAPASLSIRSQPLRALTEEATLGEAVSIVRYLPSSTSDVRDNRSWLAESQVIHLSNNFSSQSFPIGNNLYEAILKGLEKLNSSSGPRHLFLIVDRSVEGKLPANMQKLARISNIVIHAIVSEEADDELMQMLSVLSLKSGGTFLRSDSAEPLSAMVNSVRTRHASSCELSWTGFGKDPANTRIRCISGCGYGEITITKEK